jgi:hypothetical protein
MKSESIEAPKKYVDQRENVLKEPSLFSRMAIELMLFAI